MDISCPAMHYAAKVFQAADFPRHINSEASTVLSFTQRFTSVIVFDAQKITNFELRVGVEKTNKLCDGGILK